jgi:hypothetical protein
MSTVWATDGQRDEAGERTRTSNPRITNALLYRLSYTGLLGHSSLAGGHAANLAAKREEVSVSDHEDEIAGPGTGDEPEEPELELEDEDPEPWAKTSSGDAESV